MLPLKQAPAAGAQEIEPVAKPPGPRPPLLRAVLPVMACGAGLFSDGYVNQVIGSVAPVLARAYGAVWAESRAKRVLSAIAFAGTGAGQLVFGVLADRWSRTNALLLSTAILLVFSALAAGSYWHGDAIGMFNMLVAWRFFVSPAC